MEEGVRMLIFKGRDFLVSPNLVCFHVLGEKHITARQTTAVHCISPELQLPGSYPFYFAGIQQQQQPN